MVKKRKRFFGSKEKIVLFLHAGGHCLICNEPLEDGWHGDHVRAFSQGGATELSNGQALCPTCNLKKGDKEIGVQPHGSQKDKLKAKD